MNIPTILKSEYDPVYQADFNQSLRDGLALGVHLEPLTAAQITSLTSATARPVLPAGFLMYEITTPRLRIILTAANPLGPSAAVLGSIAIV